MAMPPQEVPSDDEMDRSRSQDKELNDLLTQSEESDTSPESGEIIAQEGNTLPKPEVVNSALNEIFRNDDTASPDSRSVRNRGLNDSVVRRPYLPQEDSFKMRNRRGNGRSLDQLGIGQDGRGFDESVRGAGDQQELLATLHEAGEKKNRVRKKIRGTIEFNSENVEFDPGSVEVRNFALENYMKNGLRQLLNEWFFNYAPIDQVAYETIRPGRVTVEFNIDQDGNIIYISLIDKDTQEIYNWAAKTAFKRFDGFGKNPEPDIDITTMQVELEVYPPRNEDSYYIFIVGSAKLTYEYEVWVEEEEEDDTP
jgi:hypothetical protein